MLLISLSRNQYQIHILLFLLCLLKMPDFLGEAGNFLFILMSTPEKQVFKRDLWRLKCQAELTFFQFVGNEVTF